MRVTLKANLSRQVMRCARGVATLLADLAPSVRQILAFDHVEQVARSLHGKARSIRVVDPPADLPVKGDMVDGIERLGWTRDDIEKILDAAPAWQPSTDGTDSREPEPVAVEFDLSALRCMDDCRARRSRLALVSAHPTEPYHRPGRRSGRGQVLFDAGHGHGAESGARITRHRPGRALQYAATHGRRPPSDYREAALAGHGRGYEPDLCF